MCHHSFVTPLAEGDGLLHNLEVMWQIRWHPGSNGRKPGYTPLRFGSKFSSLSHAPCRISTYFLRVYAFSLSLLHSAPYILPLWRFSPLVLLSTVL